MAIIFANNTGSESKWHGAIAAVAVLSMLAIALFAFYPRRSPSAPPPVFALDFTIADSDFVKNVEPFPAVAVEGIKTGRSEPFLIYYQPPSKPQ